MKSKQIPEDPQTLLAIKRDQHERLILGMSTDSRGNDISDIPERTLRIEIEEIRRQVFEEESGLR